MAKITKRTNKETRINNHSSNARMNGIDKVLNGTAELKDLLNITKAEIDFVKCQRKIKMIQLIYSAGSQVGACTVVAGNMYTIKLTEKTSEAFKKSLKMLKERENHVPYKSVWVDGLNRFTFRFSDGHYYVYYVVTNAEIAQLKKNIESMDYNSVTLEELQALQEDLPPFVRAWQESSIDVSKDKTKVFNYAFSDFFKKVKVKSDYYKKQLDNIVLNFDTIKQLHKAGRTNDIVFGITIPHDSEVYDDICSNHSQIQEIKEEDIPFLRKRCHIGFICKF